MGGLLWLQGHLVIAVKTVKSTGHVKLNGIEANAMKKIYAVLPAIIISTAKDYQRKKIKAQKRNGDSL